MSTLRPLRGGCQCGRNRYIIAVPQEGISEAQVLFNPEPVHRKLIVHSTERDCARRAEHGQLIPDQEIID